MSLLAWSRLAPLSLLPGCLVAFNDYPLGDLSSGGAGGAASAGSAALSGSPATGGDPPAMPAAGSGGASSGGATGGGGDVGGTAPIDSGGTGEQVGGSTDQSGGAPAEDNPYLIDDFEDGDAEIFERQGRKGSWFVSNDGSGSQTPDVDEPALPSEFMVVRVDSTRGMHTSGGPFATSSPILGTTLASDGTEPVPYDLSGFKGIRLWVRSNSTSPMAAKEARLNLPTSATSRGGACMICGDHFGVSVPLTSKWVQVEVPFSSLKQSGFGRPLIAKADLKLVTALEFQFSRNLSFDVWLDDIELY